MWPEDSGPRCSTRAGFMSAPYWGPLEGLLPDQLYQCSQTPVNTLKLGRMTQPEVRGDCVLRGSIGGGGVQPQENPKKEKGVESIFLNIPDNLLFSLFHRDFIRF